MVSVFMLLFGFIEYARLLMDWSLLNNAAREGCRYAMVNNTSSTISHGRAGVVTGYMAGRTKSFSNFTVTVSGTHQGVSTAVNSLGPGDPITVTVSGTYKFLNIIPLDSSAEIALDLEQRHDVVRRGDLRAGKPARPIAPMEFDRTRTERGT